jgi:hypothetical protein
VIGEKVGRRVAGIEAKGGDRSGALPLCRGGRLALAQATPDASGAVEVALALEGIGQTG